MVFKGTLRVKEKEIGLTRFHRDWKKPVFPFMKFLLHKKMESLPHQPEFIPNNSTPSICVARLSKV